MRSLSLTLLTVVGTAGAASAAEILVPAGDITASTTWTSDNTYNLQGQVRVTNMAALTIEAGTTLATTPSVNGSGSLAIARGSQIFALGTAENPIVCTSTDDDRTNWRASANEWGNITIMGRAYISEDAIGSNSATCGNNEADMEGLGAGNRYGGTDDDDDSGTLNYVSLRYGGRVVGFANELNGLSLGGIGRGTDIDFVEIMNNVDDGIEIWGGTVNLKHFSIWNVGDDSFDVDQGWRGKAQFGLIVQGYSVDANQGSGVGDNAFETDGAENSDYQPVTTAAIYNCTVIGQPEDGDGLTTWRDGARVQYRNCIFMDGGEAVVKFDNLDGDGALGYGHNGTLTWEEVWAADWDAVISGTETHPNDCPMPATVYASQVDGKLSEISDSVFFRNLAGSAYIELNARNQGTDNVFAVDTPIRGLVREDLFSSTIQGKDMYRVIGLDPRAAGDATTSVGTAPNDGFFDQAAYRGAFDATTNWLEGWSAADEFGFFDLPSTVSFCDGFDGALSSCPCGNDGDIDTGCDGPIPPMQGGGTTGGTKLNVIAQRTTPNNRVTFTATGFPAASTPGVVIIRSSGIEATPVAFGDGLRCVGLTAFTRLAAMGAVGGSSFHNVGHGAMAGTGTFYYQAWHRSTPASFCTTDAFNLTNGQTIVW